MRRVRMPGSSAGNRHNDSLGHMGVVMEHTEGPEEEGLRASWKENLLWSCGALLFLAIVLSTVFFVLSDAP